MAQRTAFLNSDAQGYNKDFHHTTLHNYLLSQVGVMFSDMVTKTEFVLWDWQITAGSAVVKCTRATWAFAWKEVLALFESTATESISTAWDKKVFIEIPEGYVNDSTTITDTLTQWINLWVGIIRSESDYPSHSNYIPLWEITGWDWAAATDVRPEVRRFWKKNSLSFFDDNGKETFIDLNSASINKFLMSNWPWNAPTMEDVGSGIEVLATKTRYIAGEALAKGSVIFNDIVASFANATTELNIGDTIGNTMRSFQRIGNGETISDLGISLKNVGWPSDNFEIRLETDNAGKASWTLIDVNATGLIAWSATSGTLTNETIAWAGAFTPTDWVVYHIVLKRSGSVSWTNYYVIWVEDRNTRAFPQHIYDGTTRWTADVNYTPYLNLDGVYSNLRCKTKADNANMVDAWWVCTAITAIWAEFVVDVTGISNAFTSLEMVDYYLSDTPGEVSTTPWTISVLFGRGSTSTNMSLWAMWGCSWWAGSYDIIIKETDGKDAVIDAIAAWYRRIFVKAGRYNITTWITLWTMEGLILHGDGAVRLDLSYDNVKTMTGEETIFNFDFWSAWTYETANGTAMFPEISFSLKGISISWYVEAQGYCTLNVYEVTWFPAEYSLNNWTKCRFNVDIIQSSLIIKTRSDGTAWRSFRLSHKKAYWTSSFNQYWSIWELTMSIIGDNWVNTVDKLYLVTWDQFWDESVINYYNMTLAIDSNDEDNTAWTSSVYFGAYASNSVISKNIKVWTRWQERIWQTFWRDYLYSRINLYQIEWLELYIWDNPAVARLVWCSNIYASNSISMSSFFDADAVEDDSPEWAEYTSYSVWDIVIEGDSFYSCLTAHTSTDDWYDDYYTSHYRGLVPVAFDMQKWADTWYLGASSKDIIKFKGSSGSNGTERYSWIRTYWCKSIWIMQWSNNWWTIYEWNSHVMAYWQSSQDRSIVLQWNDITFVNNVARCTIWSWTMQIRPKGDRAIVTWNRLDMNWTTAAITNVWTPADVLTANNLLT